MFEKQLVGLSCAADEERVRSVEQIFLEISRMPTEEGELGGLHPFFSKLDFLFTDRHAQMRKVSVRGDTIAF